MGSVGRSLLAGLADFTVSEATLLEGCLEGRGTVGILGTAGTMGNTLAELGLSDAVFFGVFGSRPFGSDKRVGDGVVG